MIPAVAKADRMMPRHLFLALTMVTVWGANFTVIKLGLDGVPPMLLAALRYIFTALPAVFLVRRPAIEARYWVAYGLAVGVGQFACLFSAMDMGLPAGIASVVLQSQVMFTLLFAFLLLGEALTRPQAAGLILAAAGLFLVGRSGGADPAAEIPLPALGLALAGAACWGLSNIIVRQASALCYARGQTLNMFSLVVWSSLVPPLPLLGLALFSDTPQTLVYTVSTLNAMSVFAVLFLAYAATLFGFGSWSYLLNRYPTGQVAPLSLLVPMTGLLTAWIVLGERLSLLQWIGGLTIIVGVGITIFGLPSRVHRNRPGWGGRPSA